jgi:hypothetical protein
VQVNTNSEWLVNLPRTYDHSESHRF